MNVANIPESENINLDLNCSVFIQYIESFFDLIYRPVTHLIEAGTTIRQHPTCLEIYRQKRKSRVNYLLQPNLHFRYCNACKEYVHKELFLVWFQADCCELQEILPDPLLRLLNKYSVEIPQIRPFFILTLFLVEKYNDNRDLDISIIAYDMGKKSYIEKVKSYFNSQ